MGDRRHAGYQAGVRAHDVMQVGLGGNRGRGRRAAEPRGRRRGEHPIAPLIAWTVRAPRASGPATSRVCASLAGSPRPTRSSWRIAARSPASPARGTISLAVPKSPKPGRCSSWSESRCPLIASINAGRISSTAMVSAIGGDVPEARRSKSAPRPRRAASVRASPPAPDRRRQASSASVALRGGRRRSPRGHPRPHHRVGDATESAAGSPGRPTRARATRSAPSRRSTVRRSRQAQQRSAPGAPQRRPQVHGPAPSHGDNTRGSGGLQGSAVIRRSPGEMERAG